MAIVYAFYLILSLLVIMVLIRGEWPERAALWMFVAAAFLSALLTKSIRIDAFEGLLPFVGWWGVAWGLCFIDISLLLGLILLAARSQRRWLLWMAAFQLISTVAHFGRAIDPTFDVNAYAIMESFSSLPAIVLLPFAVWRHPRRRLMPFI